MNHNEAIAPLKQAMLYAQTLGEMYVLMEDYSYQEFMQIYHQLLPQQQAKIKAICDRDTHSQLAAIDSTLVYPGRNNPLVGSGGVGEWESGGAGEWGNTIHNDCVKASDITG